MIRRQDWEARLIAYVESVAGRPFGWGACDCALFACACCATMTGTDPAQPARGAYRTARGAMRVLRRVYGVNSLPDLADAILGPRVAPQRARVGDVVLVKAGRADSRHAGQRGSGAAPRLGPIGPAGLALAVVLGAHAAAPGPDGLALTPMAAWLAAWRVG